MASDEVNGVNDKTPVPSCIRFSRQGKSGHLLVASVNPSKDFPVGIAVPTILEWISSQGCDGWLLREQEIAALSREVNRLQRTTQYTVAERKDCQVDVQVSADRLKAWVSVTPAFGGEPLTEALFKRALEDHHVRFGIDEALFQQILQNGECGRELIAEGVPSIQGEKAMFEQLVQESAHKGIPQEREDGTVDNKDLGLFLSVAAGTPLLKRIPPTAGIPGTGVDGAPIPALPGADRVLHAGVGTAFSNDDPTVIIATRVGQPSFADNSARVDPTLELEGVNPSTGNVIFDGNILIRGPVEAGFTVHAGQDITVLDTIEGANLTAGKNLVLLTGVYGKNKSVISVGGNLEAKFLSDCTVHCKGNIEVADLIAHCSVECEGAVHLGKYGGKGQVFGGKLLALRGIHARILGSVSEAATLLEIVPPRELILRQSIVEEDITSTRRECENAEKELQAIELSPAGREQLRNNIKQKADILSRKLEALKKEQAIVLEKLGASQIGKIKAAEVHRGVVLCIGPHRQIVNDLINDLCFEMPLERPASSPPRAE